MVDGRNVFDQSINSKKHENIRKTAKGDYYATRCLLDYSCFKENYKMIPIDLTKQQVIVADPRANQQIDFTANLHRAGNTTMFFVTEEAKKSCWTFHEEL